MQMDLFRSNVVHGWVCWVQNRSVMAFCGVTNYFTKKGWREDWKMTAVSDLIDCPDCRKKLPFEGNRHGS